MSRYREALRKNSFFLPAQSVPLLPPQGFPGGKEGKMPPGEASGSGEKHVFLQKKDPGMKDAGVGGAGACRWRCIFSREGKDRSG